MLTVDPIDLRILHALQMDAKFNIKEMAAELNMTKTPIYERIKRLEKEGIIRQYVALIDQSKLGPSMVVYCSVSLDVQKLDQLQSFNAAISQIPEVVECYLMGGAFDYLLKVVVKDLAAYHYFSSAQLATLPNVSKIKSSFVLKEVKRSTVLPLEVL